MKPILRILTIGAIVLAPIVGFVVVTIAAVVISLLEQAR